MTEQSCDGDAVPLGSSGREETLASLSDTPFSQGGNEVSASPLLLNPAPIKRRGGFSMMNPERLREVASRGGTNAQAAGTAHRYNSAEGTTHGKTGGVKVSADRAHMAEIGRKGGGSRKRKRA